MNQDKLTRLRSKVMFTIVGGAVIINPLYAQTSPPATSTTSTTPATSTTQATPAKPASKDNATQLQAVMVTGVRNSLEESMNIKRDAIGGVDAISAIDIGKFPDTNLADSLQRITGVSISRRNGQGSQVTVRGFGPDFNLITIDGRVVPGADAFGAPGQTPSGNVDGGTRSFNFAQLSPNGVQTLEVYKTGRADVASGGIGATINIVTDRPFNHEGGKVIATFGVKGTDDKSSNTGTHITPQYTGDFSYANPDKTWGIGIDASYARNIGGDVESTENYWTAAPWAGPTNSNGAITAATKITNEPKIGQLYSIPNDVRYAQYDYQATRKNAHLVFQLHPIDSLTMTADYLYSRYQIIANRHEQSMWLQQQQFSDITFDTGKAVATPTYIRDVVPGAKDFGMEDEEYWQKYALNDVGFNTVWKPTDNFTMTLDLHIAKDSSTPDDPLTGGGSTAISVAGTNNCAPTSGPQCGGSWGQEFNFNNSLAIATRTWYPTLNATGAGVTNQAWTLNNIGLQPLRIDAQAQTTKVKEAKLGGALEFDSGRFQFGTDLMQTTVHMTQAAQNYSALGDWGVNDAGKYPDLGSILKEVNTAALFSGYNTKGIAPTTWIGNADDLAKFAVAQYPGSSSYKVLAQYAANNTVSENTNAVYAQIVLDGQLGSFPTTTRFGMRYEMTNVTSGSLTGIPSGIVWQSNNDFITPTGTQVTPESVKSSYSNLLPNMDFLINFTDSLQGRASYSSTIARAPYSDLYDGAVVQVPNGSILNSPGAQATATQNNPALKPLSSDNLDLGLSWYFAKSSYVSLTFWDKRVENFIGTAVHQGTLFGLQDPTSGPRAQQALAFLKSPQCIAQVTAAGQDPAACSGNDTSLFAATAMLSNPATGGLAAYNGSGAQSLAMESQYDITAQAGDPLYTYSIAQPVNLHTAMLHGWEFGGQYFLGDTGFGILANYTKVLGNVHFNDGADSTSDQFALTGLSDSANAVLMYEKYHFSVRLAWNWRGEFLQAINQGISHNPVYVDPYSQYDLSINYDWNKHLSFQFDGVNLTGEGIRWRARSEDQFVRVEDDSPRYQLGVMYKF